ncbi:MAG TPA: hypothetical protein VF125_05605 [Solirubrobacterales bacterium]
MATAPRRRGIDAKWLLAVALVAMAPGAGDASAAALYAGSTEKYSVAFKAEGPQRYVMQFAGRTNCYYTEPEENVGGGGFSAFPAPELMHEGPHGFAAHEYGGDSYSLSIAEIRAEFNRDGVSGKYAYEESEESFHCDTGSVQRPFEASRYRPIGSVLAGSPERGEKRVYYGKRGPIEIFLRKTGREVGGIRGTFVPRCPLGKGRSIPARHALFRRPAFAKLEEGARFLRRVAHEGRTRAGGRFKETIAITGRVRRDAVLGTYLRVRTSRPDGDRCVTGPIPLRAVRYLPERG